MRGNAGQYATAEIQKYSVCLPRPHVSLKHALKVKKDHIFSGTFKMLSLIPLFALVFATEISPLERLGLGIMVKYAGASYCNEQLETWNCTVCQSLPQTMFYQKFYSRINDMSGYIAMTTTPIRPDAPTAKTIIISFRGTKVYSIKNWFVDFNTFQTPLQNPKTDDSIKVHRGFQSAYLRFKNSIRESTVRLLNAYPDANVHVTG